MVTASRPRKTWRQLSESEEWSIYFLWDLGVGGGMIGNVLRIPQTAVHNWLRNKGYKRTKEQQIKTFNTTFGVGGFYEKHGRNQESLRFIVQSANRRRLSSYVSTSAAPPA